MFRIVRKGTIEALEQQVQHQGDMLGKLQHLVIDRAEVAKYSESGDYRGNPYQTYESQVAELSRKFSGTADWGNQVTQNVISIRSAFTIGSGVKAVARVEGKERELSFIRAFMAYNNIDANLSQDWVREAEIEGKFLCRLLVGKADNADGKMAPESPIPGFIDARFISWETNRYKVEADPEDYTRYLRAKYRIGGTGRDVELKPNDFIYGKFGGRADSVNDTPPRLGPVLRQLEDLDRGLYDWRKINNLFAAPTPWIDADDDDSATRLDATLRKVNWKVGKLLVTSGAKFSIVEAASGRGIESLEKEITMNAKFVSGASGVPVHFLGLPDLLSNRATADNLMELVVSSTARERRIWIGLYTEMFRKVLRMANEKLQAGFDESAIVADIPFVSGSKMKELVEVWLPLYTAKTIDIDTMLSKIPEIDAPQVKKRLEEKEEKDLENMVGMVSRLPNIDNGGDKGGNMTGSRGGNGNAGNGLQK